MPERSGGVPVAMAHTLSDWVQALSDGSVRPRGIDLTFLKGTTEDIFYRMLRHREFDVAEMSLAAYTVERSRGTQSLIAIPVFPSRVFGHGSLYVRSDSSIDDPRHLEGKRIGTPDYQMTVGVWVRQFLAEMYDLDPRACNGASEEWIDRVGASRLEFRPPGGLTVKKIARPTRWQSSSASARSTSF